MAKEIITLGADGGINSEFKGFAGKSCLKAAAAISAELARLGVITDLAGLHLKDEEVVQMEIQQMMTVEEG